MILLQTLLLPPPPPLLLLLHLFLLLLHTSDFYSSYSLAPTFVSSPASSDDIHLLPPFQILLLAQVVMGDSWSSGITRSLFVDDQLGVPQTDPSVALFFISYVLFGTNPDTAAECHS